MVFTLISEVFFSFFDFSLYCVPRQFFSLFAITAQGGGVDHRISSVLFKSTFQNYSFPLYGYFAYIHVLCTTGMPSVLRRQEMVSDPLELELQMIVNHPVSSRN